ncbi:peptidylprolyl isomerase [Pelomonas sp. APW6]|uniref:Peptidyl-prolyl cis-trans isomerase n=1 Tax=Roseateles subflavus TaxID=3053353 RepID=A0ABT7LPU8_9BURK|nr:peptidylprolyl isomerase [Pelomonas sp. APW6]MDL5033765.1 peptidylprolyl isomerase [Pelomonas sp. APW6]
MAHHLPPLTCLRGLLAAALLPLALSVQAQQVKLSTTVGDICVELNAEKAPKTVANFVQYVKAGHYNGVIFHRVIDGFMIQTGGFTDKLVQKPTRAPIPLEDKSDLKNLRGTISMARTAFPDSATSQFFINVADNTGLDAENSNTGRGYAVFGQVVAGMDVVDKIRATPVEAKGAFQHLPATPIFINKATLECKP